MSAKRNWHTRGREIITVLLLGCMLQLDAVSAAVVAGKGSQYRNIMLSADATSAERYAAKELAEYLEKVTGQKFVITDREDHANGIKLTFDPGLQREEWRLEHSNGNLVISGGRPRGVLYGVYDFLEKYAGVRWLDENNEVIPVLPQITIPDNLKFTGKPAFDYRNIYDFARFTGEKHPIFRTRARLNSYKYASGSDPARYGFTELTGSPGGCHTIFAYSRDFPDDWFSMDRQGKRQKALSGIGPGQVCFSRKEVRKAFAEKLCKYIEKDRLKFAAGKIMPPRYYDISVNDNSDCCYCPECRELIAKYGESGLFIDFINDIAGAVKVKYPDITIISLGYGCALFPPKNICTADNVLMRIGQLGPELRMTAPRDTLRKLSTDLNKRSLEVWQEWAKHAKQLGSWDYWILYGEPFASPHTGAPALKEILLNYKQLNCNFIFAEAENYRGDYVSLKLQSFSDLRNYLAYKLMIDPEQDEKFLVDEFMRGFYGAGAEEMKEYYYYLAARQEEVKSYLGITHPARRPFLDAAFFQKVTTLINSAEQKCADDPKRLANIRQERIMIDEAILYLRDQLIAGGFSADPVEVVIKRLEQNYTTAAKKYYIDPKEQTTAISKAITPLKLLASKPPLPRELEGRNIFDYYWTEKTGPGHYSQVVEDDEAVTGYAITAVNGRKLENFHTKLPSMGVYDNIAKKHQLTFNIPRRSIPADEKYHWVYAGRVKPAAGSRLWLHWSWGIGRSLNNMFNPVAPEKEYDMFVSLKIQGPALVKDSKKTDGIYFDRVIFAEYIDEKLTPRTVFGSLEQLEHKQMLSVPEEFAGKIKVFDWYAEQPVEKSTCAVVSEPGAPSKFAMIPRDFVKNSKIHGRPPAFGVYDAVAKKSLLNIAVPKAQRHGDGQYHWFKVGTSKLTASCHLWMHWSWGMSVPINRAFNARKPEQLYDIYVYYKTTGPAYGAPGEDGFFVSRVMVFQAENEPKFSCDK